MALATTTLSGAITSTQFSFGVASATNITVPNFQTGTGITFLLIENEMMLVTGVAGTVVNVVRGYNGTQSLAHAITAPVTSGLGVDFTQFFPTVAAFGVQPPYGFQGFSGPIASATTITAPGAFFHVTGTTATATINLPANFLEGQITVVADGVWTWTAAGNIAVAGTVTTAGSSVTFTFDQGSGKWHPSRLA